MYMSFVLLFQICLIYQAVLQISSFAFLVYNKILINYIKRQMPPKRKTESTSVAKVDTPSKIDQPEPRTRTRGRLANSSVDKTNEPAKKVKKDQSSPEQPIKKSKTQPKVTKSKDVSPPKVATGLTPPTDINDGTSKQPAKEPAKKTEQLKKVIIKGKVPVDQFAPSFQNFKVCSASGVTYAATLNQSNVAANNNKFYILQILQSELPTPHKYYFFTRWGRVGVPGQQAFIPYDHFAHATHEYHRKLNDKLRGGYRQVQMNYEEDDKKDDAAQQKQQAKKKDNQPQVQSNLHQSVQDLIKLMFDMKMMTNQMKEIGYDAKKMPLGKLAKSSILKGYEALKGLMEQIKIKKRRDVIQRLSSDFYSQIPHDFGFQRMQNFILDTEPKVKAKLQMLQSLEDIQIFTKLLDEGNISNVNELDSNYLKLDTTITPLDKNSEIYKLLLQYVQNTHADTHTVYKLEVQEIFELSKEVENKRYRKDIDNKHLLWHGSRLTNFVGILSQGLRIAPPEAPVTGYMFGKGVYFADMVTKSANYCFTSRDNNTGLMLLCEVALGGINQKFYADYYANLLPPSKHSTKGCGKTAPSEGKFVDGVFIPLGKGSSTNLASTSLLYNEFIVYDVAQIRSRYLFKMKFNYNYRR